MRIETTILKAQVQLLNLIDAQIEEMQKQIEKEEDEKATEIDTIYYPAFDDPSFWRRHFGKPMTREEAEKIYADRHRGFSYYGYSSINEAKRERSKRLNRFLNLKSLLEIAMTNNEKISVDSSELR
jgi:hypothetical protein